LSDHTISDYSVTLRKLMEFLGDIPVSDISRNDLRKFLADQTVSKKTLYNYHIGLSVFFKWCLSDDLISENPLDGIPRPKPEQRTIEPIPEDHFRKILKASERVTYTRYSKTISQFLLDRFRNRSIILLLLDTGLRASELCTIENDHLDLDQRSVKVVGKLSKEWILYFSPTTAQAIWKYKGETGKYLFPGNGNTPMSRHSLRRMLYRACERAGVPKYSPHDFRHTFAVNFLRNYPNIYALQQMLGHSILDMVKRYLAISESDVQAAQMKASPVENWGL
jgi:integrase/recombinase XerD